MASDSFRKEKVAMKYDVEAMYNLNHLDKSMGFDNLVERANSRTTKGQADAGQKTVVDKLLADYFMGKKSEYKEANKMIYDLAAVFDEGKSADSFESIQRKANM